MTIMCWSVDSPPSPYARCCHFKTCRFWQKLPSLVISAIGYRVLELALGLSAANNMAQFSNYLRSNRKRLALSQGEVAFLLGTQSGAKVCRYERFVREPSLETALAFEAIFQRSVSELFPGLYQKVEQEVAARAKEIGRA